MLDALFVDFDLDFVLLHEILHLSLLITQLCMLIVLLLLSDDPKVVDPLPLVLVEPCEILFFADEVLNLSAFNT